MGYKLRVIICGNNIERYEYDKPVMSGYVDTKRGDVKGRKGVADDVGKAENRKKVTTRAKTDLIRKINTNYKKGSSRFITLTFKENITDLKSANYEFTKFIKRFDYYLGFKSQYTVVVEFQKRGAIHYHAIFYNIAKKLNLIDCMKIWGQGSFNCKRIDRVTNVGAYMVKYMSKNADDERLHGQKMYFNSRGLKKPIDIKLKEPVPITDFFEQLKDKDPCYKTNYDVVFDGECTNTVAYSQYVLE